MIERFSRSGHLIPVRATVRGTAGQLQLSLAIDTGSSWTVLSDVVLRRLGYELNASLPTRPIVTPGGLVQARVVRVDELRALGVTMREVEILAFPLPPVTGVQGLLGLDFFRGGRLEIDFPRGEVNFQLA